MASTNKTPHLGLCQWEATDPFLREDMNGDFARIDRAFGNLPRQKLFDVTVSQAVPSIQFDFTEVNTEQLGALEIFSDLATDGKYMRINGYAGSSYHHVYAGSAPGTYDRLIVGPGFSRLSLSSSRIVHHYDYGTWSECLKKSPSTKLNKLNVFATDEGSYFAEGDRITIWGVRR